MAVGSPQRRVLVVEDDASIRNVLYVLLAGAGFEGDIAYSGKQALSMIGREQFDAVLLDLRCANLPPEEVLTQINKVSPSLVGRVLVITGEVTDPTTMDLIARHCLPHVTRNRLMQDLWTRLRTLLNTTSSPKAAC